MSKKRRLDLIRTIEEKRNSYVLAYVLSDRANTSTTVIPNIVREIYSFLREMKPLEKKRALDLFIYGDGSDSHVSWQIVATIRQLFKKFNVIIPYRAHGAATMIALGADEIIMGEKGELSPMDLSHTAPQVFKDPGSNDNIVFSTGDVTALLHLIEHLGKLREKQRIETLMRIMDQIPALFLGRLNRTLEQTKDVCLRLLETRKKRFRKKVNKKIIEGLFSEFLSPRHSILMSEATKRFGLKQVKGAEDLEPVYWELLTNYEEELGIREPFYPEDVLDQSDEEEKVFRDHKLVYLETTERTRVFQHDVRMKKIRQIPPNVQFNPQIALPAVQLPPQAEVTEKSVLDYVQEWLQSNLPDIFHASFDEFKKGFPVTTYECLYFNKRWVDE